MRVLLVDDHPVFRDGLRTALALDPDLTLVGEAGTGREAVELATALQPDLVVMDIHMPDMNGIEATRQILQVSPTTNILMLTMFEDDAPRSSPPSAPAHAGTS